MSFFIQLHKVLTIFGTSNPVFLCFLSIFEGFQSKASVALFKKDRQFNIKPKHQNETDEKGNEDFQSKWQDLKRTRKRKNNIFTSPWYMVLFLIALLVLWYYLSGYE